MYISWSNSYFHYIFPYCRLLCQPQSTLGVVVHCYHLTNTDAGNNMDCASYHGSCSPELTVCHEFSSRCNVAIPHLFFIGWSKMIRAMHYGTCSSAKRTILLFVSFSTKTTETDFLFLGMQFISLRNWLIQNDICNASWEM